MAFQFVKKLPLGKKGKKLIIKIIQFPNKKLSRFLKAFFKNLKKIVTKDNRNNKYPIKPVSDIASK